MHVPTEGNSGKEAIERLLAQQKTHEHLHAILFYERHSLFIYQRWSQAVKPCSTRHTLAI